MSIFSGFSGFGSSLKSILGQNTQAEANKAAYAYSLLLTKRKGFGSTILTGPSGTNGSPTTSKSVLGS